MLDVALELHVDVHAVVDHLIGIELLHSKSPSTVEGVANANSRICFIDRSSLKEIFANKDAKFSEILEEWSDLQTI
jgi:hypothetical protein